MKEKINYANCMKRKCQECKNYNSCFGYKGGKNNGKKMDKTNSNRIHK